MLANVLNSPVAIQASIQVVRAFVRLRYVLASQKELARRLDALENKYDVQFRAVFDAIRQLMAPLASSRKQVGFHWEKDRSAKKDPPGRSQKRSRLGKVENAMAIPEYDS